MAKAMNGKYEIIISAALSVLAFLFLLNAGYYYIYAVAPFGKDTWQVFGGFVVFTEVLSLLFGIFNILLFFSAKLDTKAPLRKVNMTVAVIALIVSFHVFLFPLFSLPVLVLRGH